MKKAFLFSAALILSVSLNTIAQEEVKTKAEVTKPAPASPPATVTETLKNGTKVTINYAQPAVKGRTIGKDIAPYGKVWRTGANGATQFEVDKEVKINGQTLAAGKYSLFTIPGEKEWTIILNKTWNQWGAYKYAETDDVLRFTVKPAKAKEFTERMTFNIEKSGKISLLWGDVDVNFTVK
jgi:hypothetical protein